MATITEPPIHELVWRTKVSGLLEEITAELLALTEVVHEMAKRIEALEVAKDADTRTPLREDEE